MSDTDSPGYRDEMGLTVRSAEQPARSGSALARAIFRAEVPEEYIKTLPPQTVYLAIRTNGLESSTDLLEILTPEQYRLCLDFDLWNGDLLNEDNFWLWLTVTDDEESFKPLFKLLSCIDLKLIALIIGRHVEVTVLDEPTDEPPAPLCYSPDKGHTWLTITLIDSDKHRLLGRLLAFIFETNTELFYQLISIQSVSTPSDLEEGSYQDCLKRLNAEGLPDQDTLLELHAPVDRREYATRLHSTKARDAIRDVKAIEPLLYATGQLEPFGALLGEISRRGAEDRFEFEAEMTLIVNSAILYFHVPFHEIETISFLVEKIRGALNIGLLSAADDSGCSATEAHARLGLQRLYRLGFSFIREIQIRARRVDEEIVRKAAEDAATFSILSCLREKFPCLPAFLKSDGSFEEEGGSLLTGYKAFSNPDEIEAASTFLKEQFEN